jgi:hypothetical protein
MHEPKLLGTETSKIKLTIGLHIDIHLLDVLEKHEHDVLCDVQEFLEQRLFSLADY